MKAIVSDRYGSFDDLEMRDIAKPVIAADEVLVRMRAAALHVGDCRAGIAVRHAPGDWLAQAKAWEPWIRRRRRSGSGGAAVRNLRPGDAVFRQCERACTEYAAVNQDKARAEARHSDV